MGLPSFPAPSRMVREGVKGVSYRYSPGLTEQTGEKRNEGDAHESDAAARHKLFDPLRFSARIIVTITFQKVDAAPDAKARAQRDNEGLKNVNSRIKEIHIV